MITLSIENNQPMVILNEDEEYSLEALALLISGLRQEEFLQFIIRQIKERLTPGQGVKFDILLKDMNVAYKKAESDILIEGILTPIISKTKREYNG